jgi:hypothetical protein
MRLNVEAWRSIIVGIPDRSRELRHNTEAMCARSDDKSSVVVDRELEEEKSHDPSGPRIRCPLCGWSPRKDDLWSCSCGHEWNTFDSGGVCPACLHQWAETQCLPCSRWSLHSGWYAK